MKKRPLILGLLAMQLFVGATLAADGAAFVLAPGEIRTVYIGMTDREIHICNYVGSAGDLVAVVADQDPLRLAPGICKWKSGDRITLRNDSKSNVTCLFEVVGKHQS